MRCWIAIFLIGFCLALCGCKKGPEGDLPPKPIDVQKAAFRKEVPRTDKAALQAALDATNDFSMKVLREAMSQEKGKNLILSPLGLAQDLALLHESASGKTKKDVEALLGVKNLDSNALASLHSDLLDSLESDPYETLKMANAIWLVDRCQTDPKIAQKLDAIFGCSIQKIGSDLDKARDDMDQWCSDHTDGMIKEIKSPLSDETTAMFLNALLFKGQWKTEFEPDKTSNDEFDTYRGKVSVSMMHNFELKCRSAQEETFAAVEMPFLGKRYTFVAVVPVDAKEFEKTKAKLSADWLSKLLAKMYEGENDVAFPKLNLSTFIDLKPIVAKLGGTDLLKPGLDLSALAPNQKAEAPSTLISYMLQQAKMEVDEKGVKIVAVTEIVAEGSAAMPLYFDRPFFYFILQKPTNAIVACGAVYDPSKE